jgi:hypothetical protein
MECAGQDLGKPGEEKVLMVRCIFSQLLRLYLGLFFVSLVGGIMWRGEVFFFSYASMKGGSLLEHSMFGM